MTQILLLNENKIPVYIFSTEINPDYDGLAKIVKVPNIVVLSLLKEILLHLGENIVSSHELPKFDKINNNCRDILVYSINRDSEIYIINFYNDGSIKYQDAEFVQMLFEDYTYTSDKIDKIKNRNELIHTPSANKIDITEINGQLNDSYAMYYNSLVDVYKNIYNNIYNNHLNKDIIYPLDNSWIDIDYKWINLYNH